MPIFTLIFILVVIGLVMWAVNQWIPMQPTIKKILNIAVVVLVVLWLASVFGLIPSGANIRVGR